MNNPKVKTFVTTELSISLDDKINNFAKTHEIISVSFFVTSHAYYAMVLYKDAEE